MKLLEYHEDIENYTTTIYLYQILIKPYNDKLTKYNLKERIKITTLMFIFGTIMIITTLFKMLKNRKNETN